MYLCRVDQPSDPDWSNIFQNDTYKVAKPFFHHQYRRCHRMLLFTLYITRCMSPSPFGSCLSLTCMYLLPLFMFSLYSYILLKASCNHHFSIWTVNLVSLALIVFVIQFFLLSIMPLVCSASRLEYFYQPDTFSGCFCNLSFALHEIGPQRYPFHSWCSSWSFVASDDSRK